MLEPPERPTTDLPDAPLANARALGDRARLPPVLELGFDNCDPESGGA